jgi:hypothetical protein
MEKTGAARIAFRLVVAALLTTSCAAMPLKPVPLTPDETRVLGLISAANPYVKSARMSGRVSIGSDKGPIRSNATVAVERPNNMRAVLHDSFGIAWFLLVVNENTVFYSSPEDGKRDAAARKPGAPVRLGPLTIVPEDVINNVYPSFAQDALDGARISFQENGLTAEWADHSLKLEFDPAYRIKSATIKRAKGNEVVFRYVYGFGTLLVQINSNVAFEFSRVETPQELPPGLFIPPSL